MKNTITTIATTLFAAGLLVASAVAQQTPAPASQPAPAAKTQKAPAAPATKTGPASGAKTATPLTLKTPKDKASYSIGLNIGKGLHRDEVDVDPSIVLRGLRDGLADRKALMTDEEIKATMLALQADVRKKQQAKMDAVANSNKQEGDAFLAASKTQDGVVTLPSGLQYKVLKEGDGPKPAATDAVVCNYRGTLLNNTEFDSSYKRGQPATLNVSGVIKGWTEALQLMPVGSKWQLFIPPDLAYGPRGAGGTIGPNATLIFEIELLSIQPKGVTKAPPTQPPPTQPPPTPPPATP
jgi:FKBP-type peptidyl-prolyl cis-trans isomerase FklB